jgi:hypothetical protein
VASATGTGHHHKRIRPGRGGGNTSSGSGAPAGAQSDVGLEFRWLTHRLISDEPPARLWSLSDRSSATSLLNLCCEVWRTASRAHRLRRGTRSASVVSDLDRWCRRSSAAARGHPAWQQPTDPPNTSGETVASVRTMVSSPGAHMKNSTSKKPATPAVKSSKPKTAAALRDLAPRKDARGGGLNREQSVKDV